MNALLVHEFGIGSFTQDLHNASGPITAEASNSLQLYIFFPSLETWCKVRGLILQPDLTLWQAVCLLDLGFPEIESDRFPDSNTAFEAVLFAWMRGKRK